MGIDNNLLINRIEKKKRPEFWRVLLRCCQVAALTDIAFFFLFYFLNSPILAFVNIVSVTMYIVAYYSLKRRNTQVAVFLIWSEVLIHAGLGIILIGWESGFHYFLLMFIPAICLSTSRKLGLFALTVLFGFYVGLNVVTWFIDPIQPINSLALKIVHLFNLSVVFVMFSYLSLFYLKTVRHAQRKLRIMATTDPLTGLLNRRHMTHLADQEIQLFNQSNNTIGFLLIDLDDFKNINDQYGHETGDDVLINVAQILKKQVRKQDLISRWGGEEFLVIIPDSTTGDAQISAERIRTAFLTYDWLEAIGKNVSPTISVGVSELQQGESLSSGIARADRALYKGKASGRNRVEFSNA
jgi:diguanylate cyclase (GGDEF)-like protein